MAKPRHGGRDRAALSGARGPPAAASARDGVGEVSLTVTRDYGAEPVQPPVAETASESDTVMRVLDRNAEISTRYGGGFVQSIDGLEAERGSGAPTIGSSTSTGWSRPSARPDTRCRAARRSGGTTATGRPRCGCRPWSVPGRSRSSMATTVSAGRWRSSASAGERAATRFALRSAPPERRVGRRLAGGRDPGAGRTVGAAAPGRGGRADRAMARRRAASLPNCERDGAGFRLTASPPTASPLRTFGPAPAWSRRRGATTPRRPGSSPASIRPACELPPPCSTPPACATVTRWLPRTGRRHRFPGRVMRSPFAYTPRPGPLQSASPGAAVAYLGALVVVAFLYSSPIVLVAVGGAAALLAGFAGARRCRPRGDLARAWRSRCRSSSSMRWS